MHYSKIASYHNGKNSEIIKTLFFRYKQRRLNLNAHVTQQQQLFLLVFIIKMLQPAETLLHAKMREKLR